MTMDKITSSEASDTHPRRPELFFGLIGAAGTDLRRTQSTLENKLKAAGYIPVPFKLSEIISQFWCDFKSSKHDSDMCFEDKRILKLMKRGDKIREYLESGDAVALLAVAAIRSYRDKYGTDDKGPLWNHAFIFNSLKHPSEVNTLKQLYGDSFFTISVYSDKSRRCKYLQKIIAKSHHSMNEVDFLKKAIKIIDIDQKRPGEDLGQDLRDTFPLANVFVNVSKQSGQVSRFIDLIFGNPFLTPTVDEHGMFHADAAALRSADLSRQVGALITTHRGEFIAAGCNEVPSAGGGSYWEGDSKDRDDRDYTHGRDANTLMKYEIISEVFKILQRKGWIVRKHKKALPSVLATTALDDKTDKSFKNARVASLMEFGRIVHAEMSAITEAARRGLSVKDTTLYCTTFPCHMCARHIVSSGIKRVVYIEPYPKSMTKDLYKAAVRIDNDRDSDENAVNFEPFIGIAPNIYQKVFSMTHRKDKSGYVIDWKLNGAAPRFVSKAALHLNLEPVLLLPILNKIHAKWPRKSSVMGEESDQPTVVKGSTGEDSTGAGKNP